MRNHRGTFIVIVGPDGVGKTSLAAEIIARCEGGVRYFHFRPDAPLLDTITESVPQPKYGGNVNMTTGWVRILIASIRFWVGYLRFVRPALARGYVVIGDRWAYGYVAQPRSLRFGGPTWLARSALCLLPQPDLVVNLYGDPLMIRRRKPELTREEIADELKAWRKIPAPRVLHLDGGRPVRELATSVEEALM